MSRRIAVIFAGATLAIAAACVSAPPIRQDLAQAHAAPVRIATSHGFLTHAESERVLAQLRARSPDTTILDRHLAIEQALAGTPLSTGNRATLLQDGAATYTAMLDAIRHAKSFVHIEMYIFEGDDVGRMFADALVERRKAGVEVRLLYDGVGSLDVPKEFFDGLKREGIQVLAYNPVSPGEVLKKGAALDHRDHRKLMVVDGEVAFVGGINISHVYGPASRGPSGSRPSGGSSSASGSARAAGSSGSKGAAKETGEGKKAIEDRPWRDTQVQLQGPVVPQLEKLFLQQWARQRKQPVETAARYFPRVAAAGHEIVRAIPGVPEAGVDASYVALVSAIENAETRVRITNAYFVPAKELREALAAAARRGADVRLILPSHSDTAVVVEAGRAYYAGLLDAGVRIFEREDRLLHAKTATVDGVWSTVGSTNLDYRSLSHNDELNVVVLSPDFAVRMEQAFANDVAHSHEITREAWRHRSLSERLREWIARCSALFL
ncbi:MAG TPA: phospholipase D-like domain-containing protein [Usitatibacter sp.]|nr:phospholipase D-like domain-containing protein [Usitatibacter sp.]